MKVNDEGRQKAKVRIAVAVDEGGEWVAAGEGYMSGVLVDHDWEEAALAWIDPSKRSHVVWIEAEVELPPCD